MPKVLAYEQQPTDAMRVRRWPVILSLDVSELPDSAIKDVGLLYGSQEPGVPVQCVWDGMTFRVITAAEASRLIRTERYLAMNPPAETGSGYTALIPWVQLTNKGVLAFVFRRKTAEELKEHLAYFHSMGS